MDSFPVRFVGTAKSSLHTNATIPGAVGVHLPDPAPGFRFYQIFRAFVLRLMAKNPATVRSLGITDAFPVGKPTSQDAGSFPASATAKAGGIGVGAGHSFKHSTLEATNYA